MNLISKAFQLNNIKIIMNILSKAFQLNNDWINQNIKCSKSTAKFILVKLCDNASDEVYCFPSINHISEHCACSRTVVKDAISSFERANLIIREERKRENGLSTTNEYHINVDLLTELIKHKVGTSCTGNPRPVNLTKLERT